VMNSCAVCIYLFPSLIMLTLNICPRLQIFKPLNGHLQHPSVALQRAVLACALSSQVSRTHGLISPFTNDKVYSSYRTKMEWW
jgi:hypothetical protein